MTDFETHPAGTAARLAELEAGRTHPSAVAGLVEALEWYRDAAKYCRKITSKGDEARRALDRDGGATAAKALAALEQEKQP